MSLIGEVQHLAFLLMHTGLEQNVLESHRSWSQHYAVPFAREVRALAFRLQGVKCPLGLLVPHSSSTCTHEPHVDPSLQHAVMENLLHAHIVLHDKGSKPYFLPKVNVVSADIACGERIFFTTTLGRQAILRTSLFSSRVLAPIQLVVSKCFLAEQIHLEIEIQSYQNANNWQPQSAHPFWAAVAKHGPCVLPVAPKGSFERKDRNPNSQNTSGALARAERSWWSIPHPSWSLPPWTAVPLFPESQSQGQTPRTFRNVLVTRQAFATLKVAPNPKDEKKNTNQSVCHCPVFKCHWQIWATT